MPGRLAQAGAPHVFGASEIVSCPVQIGGQAVLQLAAFGLCLEVQKYKREEDSPFLASLL
jgi:hypothetical protein